MSYTLHKPKAESTRSPSTARPATSTWGVACRAGFSHRATLTSAPAVQDGENATRRIVGYAAVFYDGTPDTEFAVFDGLVERIMPGAFDEAIKGDVRALFNHDPNQILGRIKAGTLRLSVDQRGLLYDIALPDTPAAATVIAAVERGDVSGSSFTFRTRSRKFTMGENGGPDIVELLDLEIFDVGPVTFPAYAATSAGARGLELEGIRSAWEVWKIGRSRTSARNRWKLRARLLELELDA